MKRFLASLTIATAAAPLVLPGPAAAQPDPPPPTCARTVQIEPVSQPEGTLSAHTPGFTWYSFNVDTIYCASRGASVSYVLLHATTDDVDVLTVDGTLSWAPYDTTSRTIHVPARKDSLNEPDERFVIKICAVSGVAGGAAADGRLLNDDGITPTAPDVTLNYHCRQ